MIYFTGDTHMNMDVKKLNTKNFPQQLELTKKDYLIILGDFGCIWDNSKQQEWWLEWHSKKNYTTLFLDGNHENHELLNSYPVSTWNGGKVHRINDKVIHLMRGQVFELEGHTFLTIGGANSADIVYRTLGETYWLEEEVTEEQIEEAKESLLPYQNKVDYVLTHTLCDTVRSKLKLSDKPSSVTEKRLNAIYDQVSYEWWLNGHLHIDKIFPEEKQICLYNTILSLQEIKSINQEL